jgi:hypothetical protein
MADAIKISKKVYVGFQGRRTEDEVPLGFMTPYGEDDAGVKRRATVDNWARNHYGNSKTFNSVTIDNKPMIGFKIGRSVQRSSGWNGSGATYFRIEDPRGFELEITVENLVMISSICIIERGEIMQECVWGREGQRNILIPTNSEPFANAVEMPDDDEKVDMKTLKKGDRVRLASGQYGIWLGTMAPIMYKDRVATVGPRKQVVRIEEKDKIRYEIFSNAKVVKVIDKVAQDLTDLELDEMVARDLLLDPFCCSHYSSYDFGCSVSLVSSSKKIVWGGKNRENITVSDLKALIEQSQDSDHYRDFLIEATLKGVTGYTGRTQFADRAYHYDAVRNYTQNPPGAIAITQKYDIRTYTHSDVGLAKPEDVDFFRIEKEKFTSHTGVEFTLVI